MEQWYSEKNIKLFIEIIFPLRHINGKTQAPLVNNLIRSQNIWLLFHSPRQVADKPDVLDERQSNHDLMWI